jgi:anti-anti-sigma factor
VSELVEPEVVHEARRATATSRVMTMVLEGEIGLDEMSDVTAMLLKLGKNGVARVVIDFSEVSHFDYRAVRPLMRHAEALRALGGDLRLSGMSPYVFAIFRSAGAHDAFDYFADVADARRSFERAVLTQAG